MRVPQPNKGARPKVQEVLESQNFTFNRATPSPTPASPPIPPGHPGYKQQANQGTPPPQEKSVSEQDPTYVHVDLPSLGELYGFPSVAVRPIKGIHIAKFNRANTEQSLRHLVDAIGSTLDPSVSAHDLQPGDFYFLMYWQRVNSYPKTPLLIDTWCTDLKHNLEVTSGIEDAEGNVILDEETKKPIKKDKETLNIKDIVNMVTLEVKNRKPLDLTPFAELEEKYGLGYETMGDIVAVTEHVLESEDGAPEFAFLAGKASFLAKREGRVSVHQRCKVIELMTPEELDLLDQYIDVVTDFGVSEYTQLKCKDCGALTRVNISFNALTFLPSGR